MSPAGTDLSTLIDFQHFSRQFADESAATRLVVAYSGGLDSTVLLYLMRELGKRYPEFSNLAALHVHHGQSGQADAWVEHCRQTCAALDVNLDIQSISSEPGGASLENELRKARYRIFERSLNAGDLLVMAHHADDQIETLLYRLLRGAGLAGMRGIPKSRPLGAGRLFRPLLEYDRATLLSIANAAGLAWVEDESNQDLRFDRNFLRHDIVPRLNARWPGMRQSLLRQVKINGQTLAALNFFLDPLLDKISESDAGIDIHELTQLPESVQLNVLRNWLERQGMPAIEYHQYDRVLREVVHAGRDATPELHTGTLVFRRHRDFLQVDFPLPPHDPEQRWSWSPQETLDMRGAGKLTACIISGENEAKHRLRLPVTDSGFSVAFRQGGERCSPVGRGGSRPLKKLLQEYGVPHWLRDRVPLIYDGAELVAVADLWVCESGRAAAGEKGLVICWDRPTGAPGGA